ncbi:MAG: ABC transporter ATP-binding protein [Patescibacteria group bacterium]|nr:ABC transporter ATP-binding protein [Patescibacteria group bacterium]
MSKITIKVENLGKKYYLGTQEHSFSIKDSFGNFFKKKGPKKPFWALKNINFEVKEGEVLGIIGANGAGKSTILKILSQITSPTLGKATINGRISSLLEVGTGFHPELTGRENIYLNGAVLGMKKAEIKRKFDEIVDFAGIGKFLDTPVKRYSSGMYVRLAFAVAANLEPEILIIDEVLAVGDLQFQKKCLGKMQDVSKGGRTVLFVSHNLGAVSSLCDRSLYLHQGKIEFIGETEKCILKYINKNKAHSGKVFWENIQSAPGSSNVKLRYVKIISAGKVTNNVFINKDITIEVGYWNLKPGAKLFCSIHLKNDLGTYILATGNLPSANLAQDEWFNKPMPKGFYKSTCVIPANFLNNAQYSLDVGIANLKNEFEFNLKDLVSFQVIDSGEMRKEYMGDWIGVIRPKFSWETKKINNQS